MSSLAPFDPNDYRKRVLAAVERRGGPDASDPFELYDLPVEAAAVAQLDDATVEARIAEVWAFWQRQRDHPRYRALVALLVETHAERSAQLRDAATRRATASRARADREERDAERYALLDAAISRLVQRHGGVPRDKLAGLDEVGALGGLTPDEVAARVRRHRMLAPTIGVERRRQIRALLDEFGRLTAATAPPTLLALLGLVPSASDQQVTAGWVAWRSRARELPAGRLRAVVDELLVHVADLLAPGRAAVEVYLDAVAADVTDYLRPRVRAAVLVEDRLVAEDHAHLLAEAVERGLDERRAATVIAALAAELNAPVEPLGPNADGRGGGDAERAGAGEDSRPRGDGPDGPGPRGGGGRRSAGAGPGGGGTRGSAGAQPGGDGARGGRGAAGAGQAGDGTRTAGAGGAEAAAPAAELLRKARAALRGGRPREARRLVDVALAAAGAPTGQARALSDEVDAVLADADRRSSTAVEAAADHRWVAALDELDHLARSASDAVPDLETRRSLARDEVTRADTDVEAALAGPEGRRTAALRAVLDRCRDHAPALEALTALTADPPAAPAWVSAARDGRGDVVVLWAPSSSGGVTYRVRRLRQDGTWQVIGRVPDSSIEDGGAPPGVEAPIYAVAALQAGRTSIETRSDQPAAPTGPPAPVGVLAVRVGDGTVDVTWTPVPRPAAGAVEYRVRRRDGEQWRVIGRTRDTWMHDGGAPAGVVPVYSVSASTAGVRSGEGRSDGG